MAKTTKERAREKMDQWENPDPKNASTAAHIVQPTRHQLNVFSQNRQKSCIQCRSFNHKRGQEILHKEKGLATIVHEYEWKVRYLGSPPEQMGLCEQSGALTGPLCPPCEYYRRK